MLFKSAAIIFSVLFFIFIVWIAYRIIFLKFIKDGFSKRDLRLTEPKELRGTLQVSLIGNNGASQKPLEHVSVHVRDSNYSGVEDNDIRGFLDGRFKNGWNQPSQTHVRVGRGNQQKFAK